MEIFKRQSLIPSKLIDRWDENANKLQGGPGLIYTGEENTDTRKAEVRWISPNKNFGLYNDICQTIFPIIDSQMDRFRVDINRTLSIQHTTYYEGGIFKKHNDINLEIIRSDKFSHRKISIVVMLSDPSEYTGGELMVGNFVMPKEKGSVVMFLPFYLHEVKPVLSGIRKTLVIWAMGPEWK